MRILFLELAPGVYTGAVRKKVHITQGVYNRPGKVIKQRELNQIFRAQLVRVSVE